MGEEEAEGEGRVTDSLGGGEEEEVEVGRESVDWYEVWGEEWRVSCSSRGGGGELRKKAKERWVGEGERGMV